jgi:uncharacterized repeat protein (TIGR01451 family)
VSLKVTGPAQVEPNGLAEFNIEVQNTGEGSLTNLLLTASQDASLKPMQATDGYAWDDRGNLNWKFPTVPAGESRRVQLNCRCPATAGKVCVRVEASTQERAVAEDEACVEVRSGQSQLTMTVTDLTDPVQQEKFVTYEIRVTNSGTATARNVALLVIVPAEMSIVRLGTTCEKTSYEIEVGQNVSFKPIAEVQPGDNVVYRVRTQAKKAGDATVEARLKSDDLPRPLSVTEKTTVFAGGE